MSATTEPAPLAMAASAKQPRDRRGFWRILLAVIVVLPMPAKGVYYLLTPARDPNLAAAATQQWVLDAEQSDAKGAAAWCASGGEIAASSPRADRRAACRGRAGDRAAAGGPPDGRPHRPDRSARRRLNVNVDHKLPGRQVKGPHRAGRRPPAHDGPGPTWLTVAVGVSKPHSNIRTTVGRPRARPSRSTRPRGVEEPPTAPPRRHAITDTLVTATLRVILNPRAHHMATE